MKVEFEVNGFKCAAQTDYVPPVSHAGDEVRAVMFARLTSEAKDVAMAYIAKGGPDELSKPLNGNKNVNKNDNENGNEINQDKENFDPDTWPEINVGNKVTGLPLIVRENAEIFKRALETNDEFARESIIHTLDEFLAGQRSLRESRDLIISLLGK